MVGSLPTEQAVFRVADDVTHQTLGPGEDTVILSLSSGHFYTCNETTAVFLQALDGKRTLGEVVEHLHARMEVSGETLSRDLAELARRLLEERIIVEAA